MSWAIVAAAGASVVGGLLGAKSSKDSSKDAAKAQTQAGRESIAFNRESRDLANARQDPFISWGQGAMPLYTALLNPQNQTNYLLQNPMFQAAMERSNTGFKNTLGFAGKRGDLANAITQNYMASGDNYITSAMNRLLNPIQMAQNSAAGVGANTMSAGANIGSTMEGIGNANAAGIMGAGNAMGNFYTSLPSTIMQGIAGYNQLSGAVRPQQNASQQNAMRGYSMY